MSGEKNLNETSESTDWKTKATSKMKEWNGILYVWKAFDKSELDLIKSYVGLALFNKPENSDVDIDFKSMYYKYDKKKKKTIDRICNQFQFDDSQLRLSHTLLCLNLSEGDYHICVFRQLRSNGEVHFIDFNGRVYDSWNHFVETNKLPTCEYMAPKDGIHDMMIEEVEVHKSSASSKLGKICDFIACGATVTALGLSFVAAAPAVVLSLGVGSTTYYVGQSLSILVDRKKHRQTIAPTNLESVNCYANIGTSAVCGLSAVAFAKSARILELSGKYSNFATAAIKGANYTALASTFTSVGLNLFIAQQKYRDGELSFSDFANLCLDLFLMYGAISNVRQMRTYFSNLEANPTPPKGLSKGARRRWRKRQAKLTSTGGSLGNQNVVEVGAWDPEMFNFITVTSFTICKTAMLEYCPSLGQIYNNVFMIIDDVRNFYLQKISLDRFCNNIFVHGRNLYKLLQYNSREIKLTVTRFLQYCGMMASAESVAEISNIIDDGIIAINNVNEESSPETDSVDEYEDELPTDCIIYEVILNTVKQRICQNRIDATEDLFSLFAQELSVITNEIDSKVIQEYEEMLSNNIRMMGEKKTKVVLSQIGINSKNDFARKIIPQIIKNLKRDVPVDISIAFEKQMDELFSLYRDLFLVIANGDDISSIEVLETCEILNNSIGLVIQPLLDCFKKAKELYEMNEKYFGHKSAMVFVLTALDLDLNNVTLNCKNYDEVLFIDVAKKKLNVHEIVPQLLVIKESTTELKTESAQFTDDFKMETLLSVCNFYVQKIGSKEITKVYSFITDKFIDHFQTLANLQNTSIAEVTEKLKFNIKMLGKSNFNMMCRFQCESDRFELFNQVVETFKKEDFVTELIAEYNAKMHHITNFHAEYFKHLIADDGATIYTINVRNRYDIDGLKQQAANLFDLNKNRMLVVKKDTNLVILKHFDKYVAFQFMKNETECLIIEIDLAKANEEND